MGGSYTRVIRDALRTASFVASRRFCGNGKVKSKQSLDGVIGDRLRRPPISPKTYRVASRRTWNGAALIGTVPIRQAAQRVINAGRHANLLEVHQMIGSRSTHLASGQKRLRYFDNGYAGVPGMKKKPSTSELLDRLKLLMVEIFRCRRCASAIRNGSFRRCTAR
jgi:hypothetical protein